MEHAQSQASSTAHQDTTDLPSRRKILQSRSQEERSLRFHRKSDADCIAEYVLKRRVGSPAEVANFEDIEAVKYVFRLDVTMNHKVTMEIANPTRHLPKVERSLTLLKAILTTNFFEETSICRQLQKKIDLCLVREEPVHLQDVRVLRKRLNLDLLH